MMGKSWEPRRIAELIDGLEAGVSVRSVSSVNGGSSILKTSAVDRGRFIPSESKFILPADISRARCIPIADSLIISRMNTPALVGDVAYVAETRPDLYLPDRLWLARVREGAGVSMRWLSYYLASEAGATQLRELATGTSGSMKNIPKGRILGLEVRVPGRDEQDAVVGVLASVDELIDSLQGVVAKKQAIKRSMMQRLLTGKVRLAGFTESWEQRRFEELAVPVLDRVLPQNVGKGAKVVELEHIESGSGRLIASSDASQVSSMKTRFQDGDVLFGKLRAYLRKYWLARGHGVCSTEIWVLRARSQVSGEFIRCLVETDQFIEVASGGYGTHMPRSDWKIVRNFMVATPPFEEQKAIASVLSDIDDEITALRSRLAKARAVKTGMMQELLTGRTRLSTSGSAA